MAKNNMPKTLKLEQFFGRRTLNVIRKILRDKHCSIVLARSVFGRVFLEEKGFFWERKCSGLTIRITLTTPTGVFNAISECKDRSAPTEDEIVRFVFVGVLQTLAR